MRLCNAYILLLMLASASLVLLTDAGSTRRVASGEELGAALLATDVEFVVVTRKIRLSREVWVPGGTAVIGHDRRVVLQSEDAAPASAVLDLGTLVDAIHVAPGAHLELVRLMVTNSANRRQKRPSARVQLAVNGTFALWPSITLAVNSKMSFHESKFFYWADAEMEGCDKFRQATEGLLNPAGTAGMLQWSAADTQVFIVGRQNTTQNLVNLVTGEVHEGAFKATRTNHTLVCLPDPFTEEADPLTWVAVCGLLGTLLAAAGIARWFGVLSPRPALPAVSAGATPHSSAEPWGSHSSRGGGSVDKLSSLVRDRQRASFGLLDLGEMIGRGSFGKVYKGRWRGALVAVKVVAHDCSLASLAETLRESALSTSIQHPNVVITFLVRTIRSTPSTADNTSKETNWTEGEEDSLDNAFGDSKRLLSRAMSQSHPAHQNRKAPPAAQPSATANPSDRLELRETGSVGSAGIVAEAQPSQPASRGSFLPGLIGQARSRLRSISWRPPRPSDELVPKVPTALLHTPERPQGSAAAQMKEAAREGADFLETWLILEYCDQGSFHDAICSGRFRGDFRAGLLCLLDIAAGMEHLHSLEILHADLKGANVLLKSSARSRADPRGFVCKLADFGLSRVMESNRTHVSTSTYGTAAYMPCELLMDGRMSKAADVYSFAMLMCEMVTGSQLFQGLHQSQIICKIITGWRPKIPEGVDPRFAELMQQCWHKDPLQRPTFSSILVSLRSILKPAKAAGAAATQL